MSTGLPFICLAQSLALPSLRHNRHVFHASCVTGLVSKPCQAAEVAFSACTAGVFVVNSLLRGISQLAGSPPSMQSILHARLFIGCPAGPFRGKSSQAAPLVKGSPLFHARALPQALRAQPVHNKSRRSALLFIGSSLAFGLNPWKPRGAIAKETVRGLACSSFPSSCARRARALGRSRPSGHVADVLSAALCMRNHPCHT